MILKIKQNKTDDLIKVRAYSKPIILSKLLFGLSFILVGLILVNSFYNIQIDGIKEFFFKIFSGLGVIVFTLFGLHTLLVWESVIIDKKFQEIIIEVNFIIYKSVKRIALSNLRKLNIRQPENDTYFFDYWEVILIFSDNEIVRVYSSYSQSDAEKAAHKILEIINRKDIHVYLCQPIEYYA